MEIGETLRNARLRKGLTLAELARTTKLSLTTLQLIERDELHRLPGGIFTRGYLRSFAREVGVDPEEVVREYVACVDPTAGEPPPDPEPARFADLQVTVVQLIIFIVLGIALLVFGSIRSRSSGDGPASNVQTETVLSTDLAADAAEVAAED
jgi:cytoskeleton protein RodZ